MNFAQLDERVQKSLSTFNGKERRVLRSILFPIVCLMMNAAYAADNWTAFQNGGDLQTDDLPEEWSSDTGLRWTASLDGYGQSSPVVWENTVYVTFCSGANKEHVHIAALSLESGKVIWSKKFSNRTEQKATNYVSKAAPSPVVDDAGVIAFFEGGNLVALDHQGKVRWEQDLVAQYGKITSRHGLAASLEQDENNIFVWVERSDDPYIVALAKRDGEAIWKSPGVGKTSWSSPRLVPLDATTNHLVLSASGKIMGLNPATGKQLWEFDDIANNSTSTPFALGAGKFLIGGSEGRGETTTPSVKSNGVIQITQNNSGKFSADFVWRADKATSSFGSPISAGKYAYFVSRAGVVYCLDIETGEQQYAKRTASSIWATPISTSERVYLFGKSGTTTIISAGGEFEIVQENQLWKASDDGPAFGGPVLYAAAIAQQKIILRRGDRVYCIGK